MGFSSGFCRTSPGRVHACMSVCVHVHVCICSAVWAHRLWEKGGLSVPELGSSHGSPRAASGDGAGLALCGPVISVQGSVFHCPVVCPSNRCCVDRVQVWGLVLGVQKSRSPGTVGSEHRPCSLSAPSRSACPLPGLARPPPTHTVLSP